MGARRRGFALILVLAATALVFALGVRGAVNVRSATVEATALTRSAEMERVARSAAALLLAGLTAGDDVEAPIDPATQTPGDTGTDPGVEERSVPEMPPAMRQLLGELAGESGDDESPGEQTTSQRPERPRRSLLDAIRDAGLPTQSVRVTVLDRVVRVTFVDAGGLLNVNRASATEIAALCRALGVDRATAERIGDEVVDYRDADDFVSPKGAEGPSYSARGLEIANRDLRALEEMFFLPSMTRPIFDRIEPYLTVVGNGLVHAPTAPRAVLAALDGMTPASVNRLLEARRVEGGTDAAFEEALSPLAAGVAERLTTRVSSYLRAYVTPEDRPGPTIRVDVAVSSGGAIRFGYVGSSER